MNCGENLLKFSAKIPRPKFVCGSSKGISTGHGDIGFLARATPPPDYMGDCGNVGLCSSSSFGGSSTSCGSSSSSSSGSDVFMMSMPSTHKLTSDIATITRKLDNL